MGNSSSKQQLDIPVAAAVPTETKKTSPFASKKANQEFDSSNPLTAPPTVAVIGGSLAGIHTAFELSRAGFDVTILESNTKPVGGSIQCSNNCINAPFTPTVYDWRLPRMFIGGLFPTAATGLISRETDITEVFTRRFRDFIQARYFYKGDRAGVQKAGTWLGEQSAAVFRSLGTVDPELQKCLMECDEAPSVFNGNSWSAPQTGEFLYVDSKAWCQRMIELLELQDVKIRNNLEVQHLFYNLYHEHEFATSMVGVDKETNDGRSMKYDAYVICAGRKSGGLVDGLYHQLPLLGMRGYALQMKAGVKEDDKTMFEKRYTCGPQLQRPFYTAAMTQDGTVMQNRTPATITYTGLSALTTSTLPQGSYEMSNRRVAMLFSRYIATHLTTDPVMEGRYKVAEKSVMKPTDLPAEYHEGVMSTDYVRSITPDGLPLVGRLGDTQNVFLCTGFGDNELRWAPAAAALTKKLMIGQEKDERSVNPFSLLRFNTHTPQAPKIEEVEAATRQELRDPNKGLVTFESKLARVENLTFEGDVVQPLNELKQSVNKFVSQNWR